MEQDGNIVPNGTWLRSVRALEIDNGVDFTTLACVASDLTPYVREHLSQAAHRIEQLYSQLPSPLEPDDSQRALWESGRSEYVARVCGAIQHLGAALTAVGCTDRELTSLLECEEDAKEVKRDNSSTPSGDDEELTLPEECDSSETVVMELPVVALTKEREHAK